MIAVDTSALMAIARGEPQAQACMRALTSDAEVLISAGTVAEALIVASRRGFVSEMARLIDARGVDVVPVTAAVARRVADAYTRWGKGMHRARLNYGDCFAYAVAEQHACPLLFLGNDFSRTDLKSAL
jgi:ribonuclease VapC